MKVLNDIVVVLTEVPIIVCGKTSMLIEKHILSVNCCFRSKCRESGRQRHDEV